MIATPVQRPIIFFDGECGLCHGFVKFALPRDRRDCFRFAPLQGETIRILTTETERFALPDSLVARTRQGRLLTRTDAVIYVLYGLGEKWKTCGVLLRHIPGPLRDLGYRVVARARKIFFRPPAGLCPIVPPQWRTKILP